MQSGTTVTIEQPLVSVIILTYNHEKYIRKAIDSILAQHCHFYYEILIGDDASTDNTRAILLEYAQRYPEIIHVFLRQENIGVTKNGFALMKEARGRYLATCEGDDYWCDERKLQKQVAFLESHPGYVGCTHDVNIVNEAGDISRIHRIPWVSYRREYSIKDFKGIFLPGQMSTMVRRNYIRFPDFDAEFLVQADPMISDRTIVLLWAAKGKFYRLPETMSCYRMVLDRRASNITSQRYFKNREKTRSDFEYTQRLELYAKEMLRCSPNFEYHKYQIMVSAIAGFCVEPTVERWELLKRIVYSTRFRLGSLFLVPVFLGQKAIEHLIYYFTTHSITSQKQ